MTFRKKFSEFWQKLSDLPDSRKRPQYSVKELVISGILLFLYKQGFRNQADNTDKNFDYQLLQIAEIINQFTYKTTKVKQFVKE